MGEAIPNWNGDGVFTGREPHNSHRNQMKLILEKLLTSGFAAALGASFIATNPGNASSQNCRSDGFGGYRCSGGMQIKDNGFGGYRIRSNDPSTRCRASSDGFGGVRTTCY